jgi:hypothetical protein
MKVTAQLKVKFDTMQVSDKFKKRDFVATIEPTSPYPQHVCFQLTQDKCGVLDMYQVGDMIDISFNLRGREWTSPQGETKYFNTIDAWFISKAGDTASNDLSDVPF